MALDQGALLRVVQQPELVHSTAEFLFEDVELVGLESLPATDFFLGSTAAETPAFTAAEITNIDARTLLSLTHLLCP